MRNHFVHLAFYGTGWKRLLSTWICMFLLYQNTKLTNLLEKKKRIPNNQLQENKFLCNHGSIHPQRLMFPVPKISQHTLNFPLEWVKKFWAVLTWRHITKFSRNPYTYRSWSHGRYFWLCEIWNGKRRSKNRIRIFHLWLCINQAKSRSVLYVYSWRHKPAKNTTQ